jgi:aminoglycoside phosphotransferase (APT) family kinase protein
MCQFGTSEKSFQNHHLEHTRVTVKLALRAGPLGQLVELTIIHQMQYQMITNHGNVKAPSPTICQYCITLLTVTAATFTNYVQLPMMGSHPKINS